MNRKRVIEALKILREEVPQYFEAVIKGDCPCDLGLPASMRKWCGMENTENGLTLDHCDKCWDDAMEDKE